MADERRFHVNLNEVAAKVIDGEAIVMNIANGAYYSVTGAGADAWELLESGRSFEETADLLSARYEAAADTVRGDLGTLVATILEEGLMTDAVAGRSAADTPFPTEPRRPYQAPQFQKFTDMADMLALDPPMPGFDETPWAQERAGS